MRRTAAVGLLIVACLLAAAAPAGADWKQQPTPTPSGLVSSAMNGIACPSTSTCTAVGTYADGSGSHPLAEVSTNGASWAIQSVPPPAGASAAELNGIACVHVTSCIAVGDYTDGGGQHPTAEHWNGSSWSLLTVPQPPGSSGAQLVGVSCPSTSLCMAVGNSTVGGVESPLLETHSGSGWSIASLPLPSGATGGELGGVSCTSPTNCMVAGLAQFASGEQALVETWNGSNWAIQTVPSPSGATQTSLDAVSCSSPGACFVVGEHQADRWNGTSWKSLYVPTPGPHTGLTDLTGVACPSDSRCYAAGSYYVDGVLTAIAETWDGTKWAAESTPISTSNDESGLSGIACSDDTLCAAAGFYDDPVDGSRALVESFELRWQPQTLTVPSGSIASSISAVSCTSTTFCMAVDTFEASGSTFGTSAQQWNGGSWNDLPTPNSANSALNGISCTSSTFCMAAGDVNTDSAITPVAEKWNGSTWTVESPPAPATAVDSYLLAASCVSATSCMAVGEWRDGAGNQYTLSDSWNGSTWTLRSTQSPSGSIINAINSVSCISASDCVAVGSASPSSSEGLIFNWNGTSWTMHVAATPPGGSDVGLEGVACVTTSFCMAAGSYYDGTATVPLSYTWNGASWTAAVGAEPNKVSAAGFSGVSCWAVGKCVGVGYATFKHGGISPLGDRWETTIWTSHTASVPGFNPAAMSSVSCVGDAFCEGVGYETPSGGNNIDFAEQWS